MKSTGDQFGFNKRENIAKVSTSESCFDVTEAMTELGELFHKFGGHAAAEVSVLRQSMKSKWRSLDKLAQKKFEEDRKVWDSKISISGN